LPAPARPTPPAALPRPRERPARLHPITLAVARLAARGRRRFVGRWDGPRLVLALLTALLGSAFVGGGALSDDYAHRGIENGLERPFALHPTGRDLATNVDLSRYATGELDGVATALARERFRYVRQTFAWAEIEPEPGVFRWERHDAIVGVLERHGLVPVAVLHRAPDWARADAGGAGDGPPSDSTAYAGFVGAVVGRYGDRLPFVQLWDLPNLPDRWGGRPADPVGYTELLSRGFNAANTADRDVTVVLAELDVPTGSAASGARDDLGYLEELYRAGAGPFFDVAAVRLDGGRRSPFDRRVRPELENMSRAILYRDLLVAQGDARKPIWATHFGWDAGAGDRLGRETQARFAAAGVERARTEWPWMGLMFGWQLLPETGGDDEGYAMLTANGLPTPLFEALRPDDDDAPNVAPAGFVPIDAGPFRFGGNWAVQELDQGSFRTTGEVGARVTLRFRGTGVSVVLRLSPEAGDVEATLDGEPIPLDLTASQAQNLEIEFARNLPDGLHDLTLVLVGGGNLTVGGGLVERDVQGTWPMVLLVGTGITFVGLALREAAYTLAQRFGHLQRRRGVELWPELPPLPDWRPERRA
jgi:hypothetical protein